MRVKTVHLVQCKHEICIWIRRRSLRWKWAKNTSLSRHPIGSDSPRHTCRLTPGSELSRLWITTVQSDGNQEPELQTTSSRPCCLQLWPSCRLKPPKKTWRRTQHTYSARTQKVDPVYHSTTFPKQTHREAFRERCLGSVDLWSIRQSVGGQVALWGM